MRLDLRDVRAPLQAQIAANKLGSDRCPVDFRVGAEVRVVVPHGPCHFRQQRNALGGVASAGQAIGEDGHFFPQSRRRSGLPVRAREHRQRGVLLGQLADGPDYGVLRRQNDVHQRLAEHERVRAVVDVLGGARKVHKLQDALELLRAGLDELLFDDVLDCFHVVVRSAFDFFHQGRILDSKLRRDFLKDVAGLGRKGGHLDHLRDPREALQPADLDEDAGLDEPVLGERGAQGRDFGGVASIERAHGGELGEFQWGRRGGGGLVVGGGGLG